ncbi:MAG: hypothetical protein F6K36_30265 [Symploca sp. SIO3C6]|nr:hypothetical protein [Symploca sp. SIO3C6]
MRSLNAPQHVLKHLWNAEWSVMGGIKRRLRISGMVSLMGVLGWSGLQGCGRQTRQIQSLQRLQQYPKAVMVEGIVRDRVPLIGQSVYELQDSSGTIWVLSSSPNEVPTIGVSVRVEGDVHYQPMPELSDESFKPPEDSYYLKELRHHIIDP